jgi:alkylated DNA repair dioxygenase AlkB
MKLFDDPPYEGQPPIAIASGAFLLHGFALAAQDALLNAFSVVAAAAPFRYMVTPGGFEMSIAMTNTGEFGWISDRRGDGPSDEHRYRDSPLWFFLPARQ